MKKNIKLTYIESVTMWKKFFIILFWLLFSILVQVRSQERFFPSPDHGFISWLPARSWEEALLCGNGTIGAMVIGRPHDETIILNHALLYLPINDPVKPINQSNRLADIRRLLMEGKYEEATKIPVEISIQEGYKGMMWTDPYLPAFDIRIEMEPANISKYFRSVYFPTGEAMVSWEDTNGKFIRKMFVSRPDNLVVLSIKGSAKVNCRFEFTMHPYEWSQREFINSAIEERGAEASSPWLTYHCSFKKQWQGNPYGYEGVGRIVMKGGDLKMEGKQLVIHDADEVLLLVAIEPYYQSDGSIADQIKERLSAVHSDYKMLLKKHTIIHGDMYNRVKLNLDGQDDQALYSETMVLKDRRQVTPAIIERLFDASRYHILSATGSNPPNLQGIWNGNWTPPWSSDFTQDGNLQVAISSFLCCRLPELMTSYFNYQRRMFPYYRDNARRLFACRGIHIPSRTSTHGWNIHFNQTWCLTFWTGGAGWAAGFFYDYYLYTGDKIFLEEQAYPFMKEAALFYEDFLILGENGKYLFNPSYSPENNPANSPSQACINATMDVMIAKQLLRNCIEAARLLKKDKEQIAKWKEMLLKMPEYEINEDGALREWLWPGLEDNYAHRHVSHLYGLYEMIDPDFLNDSRLLLSVKRAIDKRMKFRRKENGGDMVFGLVQMAFVAANLGDRELVTELINWMASQYWTNSLATLHNPGNLFNMDLSGGFPAVIIRTLCYSEPGLIVLLPALPFDWKKGSIEGVLLRGQVELKSLIWDGNDISLVLNSKVKQTVTLKMPGEIETYIPREKKYKVKRIPEQPEQLQLQLPANQDVALIISLK